MTPSLDTLPPAYVPHNPSQTVLYQIIADHLETFLAALDAEPDAPGLPAYVQRELYDSLQCGYLVCFLLSIISIEAMILPVWTLYKR